MLNAHPAGRRAAGRRAARAAPDHAVSQHAAAPTKHRGPHLDHVDGDAARNAARVGVAVAPAGGQELEGPEEGVREEVVAQQRQRHRARVGPPAPRGARRRQARGRDREREGSEAHAAAESGGRDGERAGRARRGWWSARGPGAGGAGAGGEQKWGWKGSHFRVFDLVNQRLNR